METKQEQLAVHLEGEIRLLGSLAAAIEKENLRVLKADLVGMNEALAEKEELLGRIQIFENRRVRMFDDLARLLGCRGGVSPGEVIEKIEAPFSEKLGALWRGLREAALRIEALNRSSREILSASLSCVKSALRLLEQMTANSPVYHRNGRIQSGGRNARILSNNA
jgi:flagellar biosynthesis/type III secretory pathway chaperone